MSLYLDYNATSPVDKRVLEVMMDVYENHWGNAGSRTHDFGEDARRIVEDARARIAGLIGVRPDEVIFTSGATESNNMVLFGFREYGIESGRKHIITTSVEHKAILEAAKILGQHGFEVEYIHPDRSGRISAEEVLSHVRQDTLLVSVMHVNNETGIIQPVQEIGEALSETKVLFHTDATQSCGKLVEEVRALKYDAMSFTAHKLYGPQGIGALVLRKKRYRYPPVRPLLYGGPQEHGLRPGTTPVALAAGFGKACELAADEYRRLSDECREIKDVILKILSDSEIQYKINGDQRYCMPNTLNVSLCGLSSEALMLASKQYCSISNGSACTSEKYSVSYVLSSMGLSQEDAESAIRISWGANTNCNDVAGSFRELIAIARSMTVS